MPAATVDVVIPALDEAPNMNDLFDAIEHVRTEAPGRGFTLRHVVLADNGSSDDTDELAARRGAVVVHEPQRGYGAACLRAIAEIADDPPDVVAFVDADLADDPAALLEVVPALERHAADVAIGSRVRRAEPGALNIVQRFGNGLACVLMRILGGRRYSDLGPLRAVRWPTFERLDMRDRTWGWTVEMQMKAALMGIPSTEVDVPYRRRRAGRSKISGTIGGVVRAGTKIIFTIVGLWWHRRQLRNRA